MGETVKKESNKVSLGTRITDFCKGVKAEFNKIIWPTKDEIGKQATAVVIISVLLSCFIKAFDTLVQYGIGFLK